MIVFFYNRTLENYESKQKLILYKYDAYAKV